jgi:integrase
MAVRKDERDTWRYQKVVKLPDGRKTRIFGTPELNTKSAAQDAERAHIERALKDPDGAIRKKKEVPDLKTFIEIVWWPKFSMGGGKRGKNSEMTLREKEIHIRLHIVPRLGHLALDEVDHEEVTDYFATLRERGYHRKGRPATSNRPEAVRKRLSRARAAKKRPPKGLGEKSIRNIRATLRTILVAASRWGYLDRGVPELPDVVVPEAEYDWYQPEEAAKLLGAVRDAWERALLMFPLHTGTRMGEQRAIRWTDVDFQLRRVFIRRSAPGALATIKAPKSNRLRWVDLTPELAAALKAIKHGGGLIFSQEDGSMLQPGQFHEVLWAAQRAAGLRRITWHELRHSYASILVSGGAPLALIRGLLGHSSVKMTERYAHLSDGHGAAYVHLLSASVPENRANVVQTPDVLLS